ncbi:type II toxin-antitoxin system PemK/MazF family toxin [Sporolactobacillus pectinivorans]|uniref:type II toxin-antitoxin system PemK/MazF family toxin n=1 Tax=Sporolactobacillus pectinivorans TaxID=1591408 RepID=UPI000C26383E|nr:type II toxin-antitoxin system PemK/MazF family toxin [Sporolactobacillus pectinivorans]
MSTVVQTIYMNKENWKDIHKNNIFNAVMVYPSDTKRPLRFFLPLQDNPNQGIISEYRGDFSPQLKDGKMKAREQQIVMTVKPRHVVVISYDFINNSSEYEYILVAPLNTIKENEKIKPWYQKLITDEHPIFVYCKNERYEQYIDVSQITTIHKSLLINKVGELDSERQRVLEDNIVECLSLGVLDEDEIKSNEESNGN